MKPHAPKDRGKIFRGMCNRYSDSHKPWSRLQSALYQVIDPAVEFQIHSNSYFVGASVPLGRYWVTIGKEIVYDFPKQFMDEIEASYTNGWKSDSIWVGYEMEHLSDLIREYIDCPKDELLTREFADRWQLIPLLQVCDRRIGKRRLAQMLNDPKYEKYCSIIEKRLGL